MSMHFITLLLIAGERTPIMMKRTIVILPGILFLMSGAAIADTVVVSADQPSWTDTGVNVGTDQGVMIQANGLAC